MEKLEMNAKDLRHISKKRESLSNGVEKKNNGVLNAISSLSKRIFPPEVLKVIQSMEFILLNIWLFWLLAGTLYYSNLLNVGWFKGFYMAINVGYSIGWGDIPEDLHSQMFSSFFLMVGSSFVAAALGYFANFVILDADNWYVNEIQREAYLNYLAENEDNRVLKALAFMQYNFEKVRAVALWFAFVFFGTFFAAMLNADHWNVVNAFYFAISSLSTGGLYSLPPNSPDWYYFLTGLYCAFGVPLMGIAMGSVASLFIKTGGVHETMEQLREVITPDEIQMLEDFELADADGVIDKSEFIILCMVRTGAASPELIRLIVSYFNELDTDHSGSLTLDEITQKVERNPEKQNEQYKKLINNAISSMAHEATHHGSSPLKSGSVKLQSGSVKLQSGSVKLQSGSHKNRNRGRRNSSDQKYCDGSGANDGKIHPIEGNDEVANITPRVDDIKTEALPGTRTPVSVSVSNLNPKSKTSPEVFSDLEMQNIEY